MTTPFDEPDLLISALQAQRTICSREEADLISKCGNIRRYDTGEFIAKQGQMGNEAYYILSGSVQVKVRNHPYQIRHKNDLVGEMAILEPGERRSADLIAVSRDTYIFAVDIGKFHDLASRSPDLWRCIAIELAARLRQRDAMFLPPNEKPVIFIASSSEGAKRHLLTIENSLASDEWILRPWNSKGIFKPSRSTLQALEKHANESDFSIIVVTADDILHSRGKTNLIARDNVIFEAGLFMGALEAARVFLLVEQESDLKLPSDLNGITVMPFDRDDQLCDHLDEITRYIDEQGLMYRYCRPV